MRTEDDARYRPILGDVYLCHDISYPEDPILWQIVSGELGGVFRVCALRTGRALSVHSSEWAHSIISINESAAGSFERWIPAPETPVRNPATHPEVGDRWAYDADDGPVDIEVLEATPSKVGFRYAAAYYTWTRRSFADVCKNWRIVHRAPKTDLGGP